MRLRRSVHRAGVREPSLEAEAERLAADRKDRAEAKSVVELMESLRAAR